MSLQQKKVWEKWRKSDGTSWPFWRVFAANATSSSRCLAVHLHLGGVDLCYSTLPAVPRSCHMIFIAGWGCHAANGANVRRRTTIKTNTTFHCYINTIFHEFYLHFFGRWESVKGNFITFSLRPFTTGLGIFTPKFGGLVFGKSLQNEHGIQM